MSLQFGGDLIIKYFVFFLITLNILIPIVFINIFEPVGENSIFSHFEISLYITETEEVKEIPLEEYIAQVVYAEMPSSFEKEALKAQAVAARSYTYKKLKHPTHNEVDLCTNEGHCQAWKVNDNSVEYKKVLEAVKETAGIVATYNNEIINAVYHASSGGFTENAVNVWSGEQDYLVSVESPNEEKIMNNYETEVIIGKTEFLNKLNLKKLEKIKILSRTEGNRVKEISISNKIYTGNEIRKIFNLRSSNFKIESKNNQIKFVVKGYGHGVGLSQWGAQAMALEGKTYEEIIKHYYQGVKIKNLMKL